MVATTRPGDAAAAMEVDLDGVPPTLPYYASPAPPSNTSAQSMVWATPEPPLRSATTGDLPLLFSPPPTLPLQPTIESWDDSTRPAEEPRMYAGYDSRQVSAMRDDLGSQGSFADFIALATSSELGRLVAAEMATLDFVRGSSQVAHRGVPSVDLLHQVAPSVTTLAINVPLLPSVSLPGKVSRIQSLCIEEGNRAVWSAQKTAGTLRALHAHQIRRIHLRNASLETVGLCLQYLSDISDCVLVDDGDWRCLQLVDQHHTHQYEGRFTGMNRFLFTEQILGGVVDLTLNAWMLAAELDALFRLAFPAGLKRLCLWYHTAEERLPSVRHELLAYRRAGHGRCEALEALCLTTTRPLADIGRCTAATLRVPMSLINGFLTHLHGHEVLAEGDVPLELHGVTVWPAMGTATRPAMLP